MDGSAARRELTALFRAGTAVGLTDGEILRRAGRATGDEAEVLFTAIVERHGAMVLRVCRGVLGDAPDADDAFQATFLVLARRLREAGRPESVGGWLHGVAARVSARARVDAARRRRLERADVRLAVHVAPEPDADRDRLVQEEVGRLPSTYREVVVLCFWEGLTQEQAAGRLGCPIGTVRSRSARARDLLRKRLARRGLAPDGFEGASPAVPAPLAVAAASGAAAVAVLGGSASAIVSIHAVELSDQLVRRMFMSKLVMIGAASAMALVAAVGLGRAGFQEAPPRGEAKQAAPSQDESGPVLEEYVIQPPDMLVVEVLEALPGRPITGERLVRPDGRIGLGYYGDVYVAGLTIDEAKEKVIQHLTKYLSDDLLGLFEEDPKTGKPRPVPPGDNDHVFVDVSAYNSRNYYTLGRFGSTGRIPATGGDTVLDAIGFAGGLTADADPSNLLLVRDDPKTGRAQKWTIDLNKIIMGEDPSMNRWLRPGDRLIAYAKPDPDAKAADPAEKHSAPPAAAARDTTEPPKPTLDDLNRRLERVEARLDALLRKFGE